MDKEIFTTRKAILAIFLGILILVLAQGISSLAYTLPLPDGVKAGIFGVSYVVISYNFIKLCCNKILYISLKECHINKPKIQIRWIICAILLPVVVSTVLLCTSGELVKNSMDAAHIVNIVVGAIFSYKLLSKSFILTGGKFGVESSIVAVLGYIMVIVFTLFSMKRKSKSVQA